MTNDDFSIIGKPIAMVDAAGKTTGAGKYTDDLTMSGMLVGRILHSPFPHARIKHIDTRRAEKVEGVVAVITGKDAPTPYGILPVGHDEHALAVDKVRYVGDNVACVAAIDEATADQALELIDVEYEVLPAYFDPEEAMKAETNLIHENKLIITTSLATQKKALLKQIVWLKRATSRMKSHMPPWNRTQPWPHSKSIRRPVSPDA